MALAKRVVDIRTAAMKALGKIPIEGSDENPLPRQHRKRKLAAEAKSTGVPSDAESTRQASNNTAPGRKRRRLRNSAIVDEDREIAAQSTSTDLAEQTAQRSQCTHKSAAECVMYKVKTAAAKNQLFTKYMHLCRVAHDNGNLCVPNSIISNYGQSLT